MALEAAILFVADVARLIYLPAKRTDGQEQAALPLGVMDAACVDAEKIVQQFRRQPAGLVERDDITHGRASIAKRTQKANR